MWWHAHCRKWAMHLRDKFMCEVSVVWDKIVEWWRWRVRKWSQDRVDGDNLVEKGELSVNMWRVKDMLVEWQKWNMNMYHNGLRYVSDRDEVQKCFGLIISYSSDNGMSYQDVVDWDMWLSDSQEICWRYMSSVVEDICDNEVDWWYFGKRRWNMTMYVGDMQVEW